MACAVLAYLAKFEKPYRGCHGLHTICKDFEQLYLNKKGVRIPLSFSTLGRLAEGGHNREEANEHHCWLSPNEEEIVVTFAIEMGACGFPLSHCRLKEHVDRIVRAKLGNKFPSQGVGKNWTARFMLQASDRVKMADSHPLEDKRGRAVNPHANAHYWGELGGSFDKYKFKQTATFGSDEIGVLACGSEREHVITSRKKKGPQYQQRTDGTSIPPTVIFKGAAYQISWGDDNPLNASIGYQKKGWTSGEIGAEWIKNFDKCTKDKVEEGEYRLPLVDGHNSHYTVPFLLYAREHLIVVFCYIPHSTHIFQGLNVIVFSPLKKLIGEERDTWLREHGAAMDKNNFLAVYGRAHVRALTSDNIKAAFKKTGVWPFNPDVVTKDMLAPSRETSCEAHLPLPPDDPAVNVLATMLRKLATINEAEESEDEPDVISEALTAGPSNLTKQLKHDVINKAVHGLSQTKLAHLISATLTTSNDTMPTTHSKPSPLLAIQPKTETELLLIAALRESQEMNDSLANRNIALQVSNLLNEVYCGNAKGALQTQENKRKKKGTGTLPDGMACVLTADDFYEARINFEKGQRTEAEAKEMQKDARAAWKEAKQKWEEGEDACIALKDREEGKYELQKLAWEAENAKAQQGCGRGCGRGRGGGTLAKSKKAAIPK